MQDRQLIAQAFDGWLDGTGNSLDDVEIGEDQVVVSISGPEQPKAKGALQENIRSIRERPNTEVEVKWAQSYQTPDSDELTEAEQSALETRQLEIAAGERDQTTRRVIDEWWAANSSGTGYRITALDQDPEKLVLDIASTVAPPAVRDLAERLQAVDLTPEVEVNWTELNRIVDEVASEDGDDADSPDGGQEDEVVDSIDDVRRQLQVAASSWVRDRIGINSVVVDYDGTRVIVDVIGQQAPAIDDLIAALEAQLLAAEQPPADINIYFTPRRRINPTTTALTTTAPPQTTTTTTAPN